MATKVEKPKTTQNLSWGISSVAVIAIGAGFVVEFLDSPAFVLVIALGIGVWLDLSDYVAEEGHDLRVRGQILAGVATLVAWVVTSMGIVPGFLFVPPLIIALVASYLIFWRLDRALPISFGQFNRAAA